MNEPANPNFSAEAYLATESQSKRLLRIKTGGAFFRQNTEANFVVYLIAGRAKLTVVSTTGKEAILSLYSAGDFIGEDAIADGGGLRFATATALSPCVALKIAHDEMIRALRDEPSFSELFLRFLLARGKRTQADLIDHLFNSSEKRLARALLLMAEFEKAANQRAVIPPITQEALAEMIGTTRSRVSFFMNRFRKLGFIEYNGSIRVNQSLLNAVLTDEFPGQNAQRPPLGTIPSTPGARARTTRRHQLQA